MNSQIELYLKFLERDLKEAKELNKEEGNEVGIEIAMKNIIDLANIIKELAKNEEK